MIFVFRNGHSELGSRSEQGICLSLNANTLENDINQTILLPAMEKEYLSRLGS